MKIPGDGKEPFSIYKQPKREEALRIFAMGVSKRRRTPENLLALAGE